ncbi:hypothetical protein HWV62_2619 [Athelia sp. TMB]|nr:hypothetical protein HWV62_2619 [Athelia sp. TMB]
MDTLNADERAPLLHNASVEPTPASPARVGSVEVFGSLAKDSVPVILSYMLQNSIQAVSILIAARLGPAELSASSVALMLAFVTGESLHPINKETMIPCHFLSPRLDLGIHLQRCIALLWVLLVPVYVIWIFAEPILLALGQPELVSRDVQKYLRLLIVGAPAYIGFESVKKYLQCQGIMRASTVVLLLVFPINVGITIALVHYTPLGLLGSPLALSLTYWLSFALLSLYAALSPTVRANDTWAGFQLKAIFEPHSCWIFLKLAIPGICMVGTEWIAFEIVALAAGRLGELPLAAQAVIMTTDEILNTIPFGIGVAASTRVGNLLGWRSAAGAKQAAHVSALLAVIAGAVVMAILMATKDSFGYIFSDDLEVARLVSKVMPLVASFQVADGLVGSCGGVLRGQGRQHLGALFNIVAYYIIALPLGITLAFHSKARMGLQGLWIGQVLGLFVVGIGEYTVVWLRTDWEKEVQLGIERGLAEAKRDDAPVDGGV